MRRRTIIAIIITIFIVFLTNPVWLNFKPITVDFDISGSGICNIEVQLNKENNNKFEEVKSLNKKINLDKNRHAHFSIEKAKFPKRLRFVFKNLSSPVEIKNIALKNGKYKIADLKEFSINAGNLAFNQNTIQITPPQTGNIDSVMLTYNKPLDIRTSVKFDIKIFLIIMILTFLLTHKLTDYIANFNTIQNESHIEIIFLTVFFIFLFIPMSHINQGKIATTENRYLSAWKPLIKSNGQINYNFGNDYNKWFNDRFNLRKFLSGCYIGLRVNLTGESKKGFVDKNGNIYFEFEMNPAALNKISNEDYEGLVKFNDFCKKHNIELYAFIIPDREYIYPPSKIILVKDEYDKKIDKEFKRLIKNYDMHIINPIKELQNESKNNYLFFKTEHHWTDDGAFVGYKALMKEITKMHPEITVLNEQDFNYSYNTKVRGDWGRKYTWGQCGTLTNVPLNIIKKLHKTEYRYYTHKNSKLLQTKVIDIPYKRVKYYYYPKGADYRVVLLGTSMNENLTEFIPYTFKNVFRLRNNNVKDMKSENQYKIIKYYEKEILDYHPDMLIFCISYHQMVSLRNLFKME